jgi:hypothetical protein
VYFSGAEFSGGTVSFSGAEFESEDGGYDFGLVPLLRELHARRRRVSP